MGSVDCFSSAQIAIFGRSLDELYHSVKADKLSLIKYRNLFAEIFAQSRRYAKLRDVIANAKKLYDLEHRYFVSFSPRMLESACQLGLEHRVWEKLEIYSHRSLFNPEDVWSSLMSSPIQRNETSLNIAIFAKSCPSIDSWNVMKKVLVKQLFDESAPSARIFFTNDQRICIRTFPLHSEIIRSRPVDGKWIRGKCMDIRWWLRLYIGWGTLVRALFLLFIRWRRGRGLLGT